nr:unnamed protein product [Digitaria exilis]
MPKREGTVRVSGMKAYVPQTAWIMSGNIRDNILFGNPYDKEKYERILQACALAKDIEMFANGDLTEIGERGINMSGGQKQRIQIARSMYEDADIYLFDDPFSAVDAHTGSQIFKDCVMGILKDKTVLYVTHQVEFLPAADLILVQKLFKNMTHCIMRAPMSFFDSTPTGRILNRASNDQSVLDLDIANKLNWSMLSVIQILGTIGIMSQVAWPVFAIFIPVMVVCVLYQVWTLNQELQILLTDLVFSFPLCICHFQTNIITNAGIAGLAVTYALNLNDQLTSMIWNISRIENKMISVERILQYSRIPSEAPLVVDYCRPPNSWPQDGTINIRCLEVLDKCQLGDIVRQSPKKLDSTVAENGENWSVGQRQLFCLGRVLLKRSNVLVLDEATASVDSSTDAIIQDTIRQEFGDCTVLTVAHRIHTVVDSDLILVFSEGRIVEYDTPSKLLKNENSEFSKLVKEYSRRSHHFSRRGNNQMGEMSTA